MTRIEKNIITLLKKAHTQSLHIATEIAIRTGTALIFDQDGKPVKYKPPYKYVLVRLKKVKKAPRKASGLHLKTAKRT